ncbi:glycosyltransferase family 25 protein [Vibrio sp. ZSDZ65]|uniref:Glycosyltransferase family 25 protein n=1 Tax=Vibrio qingdaonensis TaxID=2829491 RepID=A0A9X3CRA1_9VIBR|nr:glycosyltransferase family 25 protein [Vibrio qingdaonensis]MCW8348061.1 glycosyltransferase family 25 protein [Vibrio qingdaonensis]
MKIFVVSLLHSTERRERVSQIFKMSGYHFEFFDAVNGKDGLPPRLAEKVNDKYRTIYRSRPLSAGEKGCFASHYLLWEKCLQLNESIVILEDDFSPTEHFCDAIDNIDLLIADLDYLRLEKRSCKWVTKDEVAGFERRFLFDNSCGTTGYVLTPQGASKLLSKSDQWLCAVDNYISENYIHNMHSFNLSPPAITALHDMGTYIQLEPKQRVPIYFKLTRELNRFYRFVCSSISNQRFANQLKKDKHL